MTTTNPRAGLGALVRHAAAWGLAAVLLAASGGCGTSDYENRMQATVKKLQGEHSARMAEEERQRLEQEARNRPKIDSSKIDEKKLVEELKRLDPNYKEDDDAAPQDAAPAEPDGQ